MLKPIEGGPVCIYLDREAAEAEEGTATLFWMRALSVEEAAELDMIVDRAKSRASGMKDTQGAARIIVEAWRDCFVRAADHIEHSGDTVAGGAELLRFARDYLYIGDLVQLIDSAKYPSLTRNNVSKAIEEARAKNGSASSPTSTPGAATGTETGESSSTTANIADDTDGT